MAEIVGVAVTATQLALSCLSAIDLLRRIKGGSATLGKFQQQLQELRGLSTSIAENPLLQTDTIGDSTKSLLSLVESSDLSALVERGRLHRAISLLQKQRELIDTFSAIERQKSYLCLLIEEIQARALHQIQNDVRIMADKSPSRSSSRGFSKDSFTSDINKIEAMMNSQLLDTNHHHPNLSFAMVRPVASPNETTSSWQASSATNPQGAAFEMNQSEYNGRWINCYAGPGVTQVNGCVFSSDGDPAAGSQPDLKFKYQNMRKAGWGDQNNGHTVVSRGSEKQYALPSKDDWINIYHLGVGENSERGGTQLNRHMFYHTAKGDGSNEATAKSE